MLGRAVECGEVELLFCSVEVKHEVEHHLLHFFGAAIRFVDLQTYLKSFLENKSGLRHRAFESIDKKNTAVGHIEHTLNLAAKIGVSGSVDDIDFVILIIYRYVFRKNCDATLALEVVVVKNEFACILVLTKEVSGQQHFVNKGSLAVVDMGDDSNVTYFLHTLLDCYSL